MKFTAKLLRAAIQPASPSWVQGIIDPLEKAPEGSLWVVGRKALLVKEQGVEANLFYSSGDNDWEGPIDIQDINTKKWEDLLDPVLEEVTSLPGKMSSQEIKNGGLDRAITPWVSSRYELPIISRILMVWAGGFYKELGHGASRTVYKVDDGHVVKIAMNDFGLRQNKFESFLISKMYNLPLAKIQRTGSKMTYLLVDLAQPFNHQHFEAQYGVTFKEFFDALNWHEGMDDWSEEALTLAQEIQEAGIVIDLGRTEQWGDIKDEAVITDYGMGDESSY